MVRWGTIDAAAPSRIAEDRGQDVVVIHVCDEQETDGRVRTKKIQKCKVIAERTQWHYHTRMSAAEET